MNSCIQCIHLLYEFMYHSNQLQFSSMQLYCMNSFVKCIHLLNSCINQIHQFISSLYFFYAGTNNQKKKLFVMAVCFPTGKTFPRNFTNIPSAKKWVFHAMYCLSFLSLYGKHICSLNQIATMDEEDAEYCSFETLILTHELFQSSTVMLCTFHAIWQPFRGDIYHLLP
jgi:hypothetical protein